MKFNCPNCGEVLIDLTSPDSPSYLNPIAFELAIDSWKAGYYGAIELVCDIIIDTLKVSIPTTSILLMSDLDEDDDEETENRLATFIELKDRVLKLMLDLLEGLKGQKQTKQALEKSEIAAKTRFEQFLIKEEQSNEKTAPHGPE